MAFMFQAGGGILNDKGELIFGTDARDANIKALTYMTDFATKHKVMPDGIASYNTEARTPSSCRAAPPSASAAAA
jgi:hypothetical protein